MGSAGRHLSGIVSASCDALVVTARDGTILAWSPGAERLYCPGTPRFAQLGEIQFLRNLLLTV